MPSSRRSAMDSAVSRNGASVVHVLPVWTRKPQRAKAACAKAISDGSASANAAGRQIMITRPLVPERAIHQDVIRRRADVADLAGRRDIDEQSATRGEQLLGHQHVERLGRGTGRAG